MITPRLPRATLTTTPVPQNVLAVKPPRIEGALRWVPGLERRDDLPRLDAVLRNQPRTGKLPMIAGPSGPCGQGQDEIQELHI